MKKILFLITLLFFFFSPKPALAIDEGWTIDSFNSDISVEQTGEVNVIETIAVDFDTLSKHGIYRDIPYVYESNGQKTYTEIVINKVKQNGESATYETTTNDNYFRIKIGDADKTISGKNTYSINYTAKGVLRGFPDHDELYWNVTGNNWPVPIKQAMASVTLPSKGIEKIACFQGYAGSQGDCIAQKQSEQTAQFSTRDVLDSQQGLTIVTGYTKGMVPLLVAQRPKTFWEKLTSIPSETIFTIIVVFSSLFFINLWFTHGRDHWSGGYLFGKINDIGSSMPLMHHETIVVEFTPPEKLRPAEIGVLMDERADTKDIVSTIIDLAGRGYLTITEVQKKWIFGETDYILDKKNKEATDLRGYEKKLLEELFDKDSSVKVSSLKTTFYEKLKEIKEDVYQEVVSRKLFPANPEKIRRKYFFIGIGLIIGGIFIVQFNQAPLIGSIIPGLGSSIGVSGIILTLLSPFMPRKTAYGRELYRRAKGYYLFINTAEKYRQQFFEKKNMFNEVLPYAIMFGLTTKFAKQMNDMGVTQTASAWYIGTQPFNGTSFGNTVNGFSNSLSSAIAASPQGSGFSGGSGGGFGAGGGR